MPPRTKLEDNSDMADTLVECWRATHCKAAAYKAVGIDQETLERYLRRGAEGEEPFAAFAALWEKAEADWIAERCLIIRKAAQGGTWQAAAWDLERHLPDEFALRQRHEHSGPEGGPIKHEHRYGHLSTEDLAAIAAGGAGGTGAEGGEGGED